MIEFVFPSLSPLPRRQHFRKKFFLGTHFIPKVPLKTVAPPPPQLFYASYAAASL